MKILVVTILMLATLAGCGRTSEAEEAVKYELIDPESALFRNVQPCYFNNEVIEGEVNSKNRMGGYVGFTRFMFFEGRVAIGYSDPDWTSIFEQCTKNMPSEEEPSRLSQES